jgi:hypothetical protein
MSLIASVIELCDLIWFIVRDMHTQKPKVFIICSNKLILLLMDCHYRLDVNY